MMEISAEDLHTQMSHYTLVDVRDPHELVGPEGQIKGVILAPLGPTLLRFLETADPTQVYVFICRSGIRSAQACELARACGFEKVYNLKGGMLAWNKNKVYPKG